MTAVKNFRRVEWYYTVGKLYYAYSTVIFVTVPKDVNNTKAISKFAPKKFRLIIVVVVAVVIFAI